MHRHRSGDELAGGPPDPVDPVEWAQARAQAAFGRGRAAAEHGDAEAARRWLERARRLSGGAVPVDVALALARLAAGDPAGAAVLLQALLRRFEFREGWMALAAAHRALGDPDEAAGALQRALSRHAPDPAMHGMMTAIARAAMWPGWCGLSGSGRLLVDGAAVESGARGYQVRLDGEVVAGGLPEAWRQARRIELRWRGAPLLGSPIDIRSVLRCEGFVEPADGALRGWLWHPGEPERVPVLTVVGACGARRQVELQAFAEEVDSAIPLARPRRLCLPERQLPGEGPWRLLGKDGTALAGSPVQPGDPCRRPGGTPPVPAQHVGGPPASRPPNPDFDVVIPVFRDLRRTLDCIGSVRETITAASRIVVVEDASPEAGLPEALDRLAETGDIVLLRNGENRGFPHSANRGIAASAGRDVILLNSDTLVASGWAEALRAAAYSASDIGTATPLSNDASILSYPSVSRANGVPDRAETRRLMALARGAGRGRGLVEIPTGNGFCMYLRRDCLEQSGPLREDLFAQGYGEENDFCLRARHLGWRHVAVPGAYVGHVGGVSFGAARTALMRRNLALLNRLHPGYDALIASHIERDPLWEARRRIDRLRFIAGRAAEPRAVLLITHAQAGGVERVVQARAAAFAARNIRPIILRPQPGKPQLGSLKLDKPQLGKAAADTGGEDGWVLVDVAAGEGEAPPFPNLRFRVPGELDRLAALLSREGVLHAEWHHWLGHDPSLRTLCARLCVPYEIHVHDYALFCARIALVGPGGGYCGEPDVSGCEACVAQQGSNLGEPIAPAALRARSALELAGARAVIVPSADAARRVARHFPAIRPLATAWEDDRPELALAQFADRAPPPPATLEQAEGRARICVVGGIGIEKGFEVLLACLRDARSRRLPLDFVVVGHSPDDDALFEAGCLDVTGQYRDEEAVPLIRAQRCDLAFFPSVWPETWCFALSLAWRAGLAAAVFDLGAQAERVRRTGRGVVLPLGLGIGVLNDRLQHLCDGGRRWRDERAQPVPRPLRTI